MLVMPKLMSMELLRELTAQKHELIMEKRWMLAKQAAATETLKDLCPSYRNCLGFDPQSFKLRG
jgi:hypothetical protein